MNALDPAVKIAAVALPIIAFIVVVFRVTSRQYIFRARSRSWEVEVLPGAPTPPDPSQSSPYTRGP